MPIRELLGDEMLDVLLERSKDGTGWLRPTGEGSMLVQLVKTPAGVGTNPAAPADQPGQHSHSPRSRS
ncbi:hypothetical protein F8568_025775 [Actinomadura sp. LD22]|uniref:Uncharacterized protein n=1 Tax=Actinomadura physcomitrii TaxID=2650748 RepID=A0A6I4MDG4_9ACTN|nr:hypothetical protein [Actinomadura physcomitrii]MWA03733.1 hypothetical protein [Actinomadura physcomitrii]